MAVCLNHESQHESKKIKILVTSDKDAAVIR